MLVIISCHFDVDGVFLVLEPAKSSLPSAVMFSVKRISAFLSLEFPIVIVGQSPLSAGLVRKQVPLLHPAA